MFALACLARSLTTGTTGRLLVSLLVLSWHAGAAAQGTPVRILDLNTTGAGDGVKSSFARLGELAYFAGNAPGEGSELWRTDGTAEGTSLAVDIRPGADGSDPSCLVVVGDVLFFSADDGVHGPELWTSDGTPEGTRMIADAVPGPDGLEPCEILAVGDLLFFRSSELAPALWRSDGTEAGTFLLREGTAYEKTAHEGELFFQARDDEHGAELWASDGTELGTRRVADLFPGPVGSRPESFAASPAGLLFRANAEGTGSRLWITDGTETGTTVLPSPERLCGNPGTVGDAVYLGGLENDVCGVWRTDGTPSGAELVAEIDDAYYYVDVQGPFVVAWDDLVVPIRRAKNLILLRVDPALGGTTELTRSPSCGGGFLDVTPFGEEVFFATKSVVEGWELFRTDGTESGTQIVAPPTVPGRRGSNAAHLTPLGDRLLFAARDAEHGFEPWITDGTEGGTHVVRDLHPGTARGVGLLRHLDGTTYFQATQRPAWDVGPTEDGGSIQEPELWRTDGTAAGTEPVPGIDFTDWVSIPLATDGARTYLLGRNAGEPWALWTTDGTAAGAQRVRDLPIVELRREWGRTVGGRLLFTADEDVWVSDGTAPGTVVVAGGFESPSEAQVARLGDALLFVAGTALRRTDGTPGGTRFLGPAAFQSPLVVLRDHAFFFADDFVHGIELWKTDGTPEGTQMVRDLLPGAPSAAQPPFGLAVWRGSIYFGARGAGSGAELWRTDGTETGTVRVHDLVPGGESSRPQALVPAGHRLFFTADGPQGRELAVSDGTPEGTRFVADLNEGPTGSEPDQLVALGGDVYFTADDGEHGRELWYSDGSEAGTRLAADIRPGARGGAVRDLTDDGRGVVFSASDGLTGVELWTTTCGDGVVDESEECDAGGDNGANGSCCSRTCRRLSEASDDPGLECGLDVDTVRLRQRPGRASRGDRLLLRGRVAPGSSLDSAADLRIDVSGAAGLHVSATWPRTQCAQEGHGERCVDVSGGALLVLRTRSSGETTLRVQIEGLDLPDDPAGPMTVSLGESGATPLGWTAATCRGTKRRLTCSAD